MTLQAVFGEDNVRHHLYHHGWYAGREPDGARSLTLKKDGKDPFSTDDFPEVKNASAVFKGWFYGGETKTAQDLGRDRGHWQYGSLWPLLKETCPCTGLPTTARFTPRP